MSHLIISGGTRGIGRACVSLFAGKGYKVSSLSRTGKPDNAVEGVLYLQCDFRDPAFQMRESPFPDLHKTSSTRTTET